MTGDPAPAARIDPLGLKSLFLLCRDDRFFPSKWIRAVVRDRLGITPDEIDGGHCVALSRPKELAERLVGYVHE